MSCSKIHNKEEPRSYDTLKLLAHKIWPLELNAILKQFKIVKAPNSQSTPNSNITNLIDAYKNYIMQELYKFQLLIIGGHKWLPTLELTKPIPYLYVAFATAHQLLRTIPVRETSVAYEQALTKRIQLDNDNYREHEIVQPDQKIGTSKPDIKFLNKLKIKSDDYEFLIKPMKSSIIDFLNNLCTIDADNNVIITIPIIKDDNQIDKELCLVFQDTPNLILLDLGAPIPWLKPLLELINKQKINKQKNNPKNYPQLSSELLEDICISFLKINLSHLNRNDKSTPTHKQLGESFFLGITQDQHSNPDSITDDNLTSNKINSRILLRKLLQIQKEKGDNYLPQKPTFDVAYNILRTQMGTFFIVIRTYLCAIFPNLITNFPPVINSISKIKTDFKWKNYYQLIKTESSKVKSINTGKGKEYLDFLLNILNIIAINQPNLKFPIITKQVLMKILEELKPPAN